MLNLQLSPLANAVVWALVTAVLLWVSRRSLRKPGSHGFYRFFAWECILGLVLLNLPVWELDPLAPHQIASWLLLAISPVLAIAAVRQLRQVGRPADQRPDGEELFAFERTTQLVTAGVFGHIRHPMYAALLALAWGAFLKQASPLSTALVVGASVLLVVTALRDEAECLRHFGQPYADYMRATKRFVPFIA